VLYSVVTSIGFEDEGWERERKREQEGRERGEATGEGRDVRGGVGKDGGTKRSMGKYEDEEGERESS
jgi:hypothetical protein